MSTTAWCICSFLALLGGVSGRIHPPIPIQDKEPGTLYELGGDSQTSRVLLEVVLEVTCPESDWAWSVLKDVSAHYGTELALVVHQYPLPFHHNAHLITQGFYLIEEHVSQAASWLYMEETMHLWQNFSNANTAHMTPLEIVEVLADFAVEITGVDRELFVDEIQSYRGYTMGAVKYIARRGAAGTPWFYVNGVDLRVNAEILLTFEEWLEFLDPLFEDNRLHS